MKVHAKGTFLCSRAAARIMRTLGNGGAIINTTSISGLAGNFGQSNYGAAKMAIYAFTKICAMELARFGIRVNCVAPSGFTRMVATVPGAESRAKEGEKLEEISSVTPTARLAIYLASELAKKLNGRVMGSHGGIKGNKISEFKMINSEGLEKHGGMFTIDEIAQNIDKILCPEPDIVMSSGAYVPK
jgi:NAD(P)-dependent dehydrogenase (short-subunit alcohol dehydrogenase family)